MNHYEQQILDNGIRLITSPLRESQTITIIAMFGTGSRYETPTISGVSHFLEHMFFKGTPRRPQSVDITRELDAVGAEFNAFTGKDHTAYYVKCDARHAALAIDVVSDILLNAKIDEAEFEKEKGVITEEINMYEDNPLMYVSDIFEEEMYKGSPLGWLISGTRQTVQAMKRQDMVDYKQTHYRGDNTVISVAGNLAPDTVEMIQKSFGALPGKKIKYAYPPKFDFEAFKGKQDGLRSRVMFRESEQAQIAFGFPAYSHFDKEEVAASLLSNILGGTMSSRLFVSVREDRALAYMIRSSCSAYQDTGNFMIQSGLDKKRLGEALTVIRAELDKVKAEGVTEEELKRAKDYIRGKKSIHLEDTASLAQWYGEQAVLTNKTMTPQERMAEIDAVTVKQVQKAAQDLFDYKKATLAIIGPFKDAGEFEKIFV